MVGGVVVFHFNFFFFFLLRAGDGSFYLHNIMRYVVTELFNVTDNVSGHICDLSALWVKCLPPGSKKREKNHLENTDTSTSLFFLDFYIIYFFKESCSVVFFCFVLQ